MLRQWWFVGCVLLCGVCCQVGLFQLLCSLMIWLNIGLFGFELIWFVMKQLWCLNCRCVFGVMLLLFGLRYVCMIFFELGFSVLRKFVLFVFGCGFLNRWLQICILVGCVCFVLIQWMLFLILYVFVFLVFDLLFGKQLQCMVVMLLLVFLLKFVYLIMQLQCRWILLFGNRWKQFFGGFLMKFLCLIYSLCEIGNVCMLWFGWCGCMGVVYVFLRFFGQLLIMSFSGLSIVIVCVVLLLRLLCSVFLKMFMLIYELIFVMLICLQNRWMFFGVKLWWCMLMIVGICGLFQLLMWFLVMSCSSLCLLVIVYVRFSCENLICCGSGCVNMLVFVSLFSIQLYSGW